MIVVRDTRELEEKYNINSIPDDEQIRVVGGMAHKSKYSEERYQRRTTYTARQLKQIIQQMRAIEDTIPENWDKWQRAKYLYMVLASNVEYNYDRESYKTQQSSNLTILLSGKGICAGYALTFKEMMDRQGIECDYVRGYADIGREGKERHAWNILTIDGISIPVDVTWESGRIQSGEQQIQYFGNDANFLKEHVQDPDEKAYQLNLFSNDAVDSIDISQTTKRKASVEEKRNAIKLAIEETYKKVSKQYGEQCGYRQVCAAIKKFVKESELKYFTRQGRSRQSLAENVSQEDMLNTLIDEYILGNVIQEKNQKNILGYALRQNLDRYGVPQAHQALKSYILSAYTRIFYKK